MWLAHWFSINARRAQMARHSQTVPLQEFYRQPLPLDSDYRQSPLVVLDLETSGLDSRHDEILSIGLIQINSGQIELGSAWHQLVKPTSRLESDNVVIHQLTDDELHSAPSLEEVLPKLLKRLSGRVMVAHHSVVELGFLQQACRRVYGEDFYIPVIDTLVLAQQKMHKQHSVYAASGLRLANLCQQYGLPRIKAHNALNDALATAELFLAQAAERAGKGRLPLRRLLKSRMG